MRLRLAPHGVWIIDRHGSSKRHGWTAVSIYVVGPLVFLACLALSINRSTNFVRLVKQDPSEALGLYGQFSRASVQNLIALEPPPAKSDLPTLELFAQKNSLAAMHKATLSGDPRLDHEPGGDRPYFDAYFCDESGKLQKAKIAYRGAYHYHHWPEKPSLRVKIRKSDVALGRRYVELTRPKDVLGVRHQIPEDLARRLGIVSTINDPVRLFINNKYYGVYLRSYRPEEELTIASGRMSGVFFKGDAVGPNQHIDLWEASDHWNVFGDATPEDLAVFDRFLAILRAEPSHESIHELLECLDGEVYARWSASMIVAGCVHTDATHNHMYFLCANQGKLEAVPWDPTCYERSGRAFTPVNIVNHPVLDRMIRNPQWVHRRNELIHELIQGAGSAESIKQRIDERLGRMLPNLKADAQLSEKTTRSDRTPRSVLDIDDELAEIRAWARDKEAFLRQFLSCSEVSLEEDAEHSGQTLVSVGGNVAVRVRHTDGAGVTARDATGGRVELLYPGLSEQVYLQEYKPDDVAVQLPYVAPVPLVYAVEAAPADLLFENAVTGSRIVPIPAVFHRPAACRTLSASRFTGEPEGVIELGPGDIVIDSDLFVSARQTLTIHPGTRLRLRRGVGIYSRGQVLAAGEPHAPILFEPAADAAWGAVGVYGAGTAGSRFEHVRVSGGSTGSVGGLRFKGMFNVYNCPDVILNGCDFGENHIGDDAVNIAESSCQIRHCTFHNALCDALDLDMCCGTVADCHWRDSGNDGLDSMTCRLRVERCVFERSGDKGISIGEGSQVLVRGCRMIGCTRGVEVKDSSRAIFIETQFEGNETGYHSYQKKWLYPRGGSGLLVHCAFRDDAQGSLDVEARSDVTLLGTNVGAILRGADRVRRVETTASQWQRLIHELGQL